VICGGAEAGTVRPGLADFDGYPVRLLCGVGVEDDLSQLVQPRIGSLGNGELIGAGVAGRENQERA
jgi:hypothetical protein